MRRFDLTASFAICCVALVLGVYTLAENQSSQSQSDPEIDQSVYAEVATTTSDTVFATSSVAIDLPILVYHIVRPSYPDDSPAVRSLALTPETFDAELGYLERAGYHIVPFSALEDHFQQGTPLPEKSVILSFDDGWRDQFTYAFPILAAHHATATFFVFTNAIGRKGFFSWEDLQMMLEAGMTIGSHSRSHPYLTRLATSSLASEIEGSKALLEERLGVPIREFAYPFGQYTNAIAGLVRQAGYRSARGDFESGKQSKDKLYGLSALNAPTTLSYFKRLFPPSGFTRAW